MANVKISDLPAGTAALTDIVPVMNTAGTTTSKITVSAILDLLVNLAPGTLNDLNELAAAIGDDATFFERVPTGHWPSETSNSGKLLTTNGDGSDSALSWTNTLAASLITSGKLDIDRLNTGTGSTDVCVGNDPRLSDARTPVAHSANLITSDEINIARIPTITQAKLPTTAVVSDTSTEANSAEIDNVVSISQTNYNSLVSAGTTNATTLYVIT